MTDHPITPPPELVQQWWAQETYDPFGVAVSNLATQAARWGADQELEACCEWLDVPNNRHGSGDGWLISMRLHAARRPKPPSLKEQALAALAAADGADHPVVATVITADQHDLIRRALESLPE